MMIVKELIDDSYIEFMHWITTVSDGKRKIIIISTNKVIYKNILKIKQTNKKARYPHYLCVQPC